jgi:FAD/FMN-containing dehydrogenase
MFLACIACFRRTIADTEALQGGLGPSSRMWGSCLDHVLEVEVVTADGSIKRASQTQNSDLFFVSVCHVNLAVSHPNLKWRIAHAVLTLAFVFFSSPYQALKGAGAGFGVITKFIVRTQKEPGNVVQYSYSVNFAKHSELAPLFQSWQTLISDPNLDRRFSSEFVMHELGAIITGTFYGTQEEFKATGIPGRLPANPNSLVLNNWLGAVAQQAQEAALWLSEARAPFIAKSLAFTKDDLLPANGITKLMNYISGVNRGTLIWFLIFDVTGGAINDVAMNATAYRHRDKVMFCQGYGIGIPTLNQATKDFVSGIISTIRSVVPGELSTYAGYVDASLTNAQQQYWGPNLATLQSIKKTWDPTDLFHNPQSVRPAA